MFDDLFELDTNHTPKQQNRSRKSSLHAILEAYEDGEDQREFRRQRRARNSVAEGAALEFDDELLRRDKRREPRYDRSKRA
jgi:hypothetical protein